MSKKRITLECTEQEYEAWKAWLKANNTGQFDALRKAITELTGIEFKTRKPGRPFIRSTDKLKRRDTQAGDELL